MRSSLIAVVVALACAEAAAQTAAAAANSCYNPERRRLQLTSWGGVASGTSTATGTTIGSSATGEAEYPTAFTCTDECGANAETIGPGTWDAAPQDVVAVYFGAPS